MTSGGIALNVDLITSQLSVAGVASNGQGSGTAVRTSDRTTIQETPFPTADTVSITNKSQETVPVAGKDKAGKEKINQEKPAREMKDVLFSYNFRGKLRIRFMDSTNRLIYQIPSVMVARTQDLMQRSSLAVNMWA
jgi:hypothetical protein